MRAPRRPLRALPALAVVVVTAVAVSCGGGSDVDVSAVGDAGRGHDLVEDYGCVGCHRIPGVRGYTASVGPPLDDLAEQAVIAGRLSNTPANLIGWIMDPTVVDPLTAMPDLGVSEADARDIAAYLLSR